jgi:hypothetical protein
VAKKPKIRKTEAQQEAERIAKRSQDLAAVNLPPEAANLPLQADIDVTRAGEERAKAEDGKKVDHDTARRHDAFSALKSGMAPGAYDAARRFELDLLTRHGVADRGRSMERVDCTGGHATDAIMQAAQRVDDVRDRIAPRDYWLLCELIVPPIDRGTWRDHVAYITGEMHVHGQGAVVRGVCVNLRDAYTALERKTAA